MSHSVTIQTRTVTTGSPSAINTTFCRSWTGILKLAQVVVGLVIMSLEVDAINESFLSSGDTFLMLVATAFMIGTAIFIISYVFSPVSEAIIGKTNYEIIYNSFALFFILIASIVVLAQETNQGLGRRMVAAILGIIDAILYAGNTALAVRNKL
ncbi:PREDICTED: uncharacterized protein LOC105361901 isoform X2 [Ceratosolen solmsi marchali]|uniref:Uncharacterized protein LOC105361901 isoform X2 n=1 Tax=Ceratosolen solmsi marchali TaxID=326594 RepID=A0AAJ7DV34_9HYME|nr:PREDICTED: uncharacterized protein LOC105361901 isoform X2 [Ceratosolen solmsi marchali]